MRYWHLRFSSVDRMTLFPSEASKRRAACTIARVAGRFLVMFSIADDHCHIEVVCKESELGHVRSGLSRSLGGIAAVELAPSYVVEVKRRAHLRHNVDYFLKQGEHHGLDEHPALDAGSCFQDLVGARLLKGFDPALLKRALPRLRREDLLAIMGLPPDTLDPIAAKDLRRIGAFRVVDAAAASLGLPTSFAQRGGGGLARRAVVQLAELGGMSRRDAGEALELSARTIRRLATAPTDMRVTRAIRLRLSLEETVAGLRRRRAG